MRYVCNVALGLSPHGVTLVDSVKLTENGARQRRPHSRAGHKHSFVLIHILGSTPCGAVEVRERTGIATEGRKKNDAKRLDYDWRGNLHRCAARGWSSQIDSPPGTNHRRGKSTSRYCFLNGCRSCRHSVGTSRRLRRRASCSPQQRSLRPLQARMRLQRLVDNGDEVQAIEVETAGHFLQRKRITVQTLSAAVEISPAEPALSTPHFQPLTSGRSSPNCSMYSLCSTSFSWIACLKYAARAPS